MDDIASGTNRVHHLDGRDLAYGLRGLTPAQRACVAVAYNADGLVLHRPTDKQLAALYRVSVPSLAKARNGSKPPTDAAVDRIVAKLGAERVLAALDRATTPATTSAAE